MRDLIPNSTLDQFLTRQVAVAWAGESGESGERLGWWRSDLVSEFGGEDLFRRLLPTTWLWAVLQAVREAGAGVFSDGSYIDTPRQRSPGW